MTASIQPAVWPALPWPLGVVSVAPHPPGDESPMALHPTMLLSLPLQPLFFFLCPFFFFKLFFFFLIIFHTLSGGPSVHWPHGQWSGPPQRALTCSLPATLSDFFLHGAPRPTLTPEHTHTHMQAHTCPPTHTQSGPTIIGRARERTGEKEREIWWRGGLGLLTLRNACPKWGRGGSNTTLVLSLRPMSLGCW